MLTPLLHLAFKIPMPIAVGSALCTPALASLISRAAPPEEQGTVQGAASALESLANLKRWVDSHPGEDLTVITMVGTPLSMRETDFASLKSSVMAHQTLDVEQPAAEGR